MTEAAASKPALLTPRFRVSFPSVVEKSSFNGGNPRFSVTGLFYPKAFTEAEKLKWTAIKTELAKVCQEFFKKPYAEMKAQTGFKIPFHKGDEKTYQGYGDPNMIYFTMANSSHRPEILDVKGQSIGVENQDEFYAGCWARASVKPYAFDKIGKGLSLGLANLQKLKDDTRFDGVTSAADDFGSEMDEEFADDGGIDDDDDM